jgi:hypothetical protein
VCPTRGAAGAGDIGEKAMTEQHSTEDAPNAQGTTTHFSCELCKQPIEKAVDCVEVPLASAFPAVFMHHVAGGNPVRFHFGCWFSDRIQDRVAADLTKHKAECEQCTPNGGEQAAPTQNDGREPEETARKSAAPRLTNDARGLGPRQTRPFAFGVVNMIVGEGGVKVPGFVPTKNETLQLVRYWATEIIDLDFSFFLHGTTGSSEWRTREFANRRLNTISKLIGQQEVSAAVEQATETFAKRVDARAWKVFWEGTKEEQEEFQQFVQEQLERDITESGNSQTDG